MKFNLFLINVFCLEFGFSINSPKNEVNMIVDVIQSYDKPTAVIAKVCWKSVIKLNLIHRLSKVLDPRSIRFVHENNGIRNLAPKTDVLILVDLSCNNSRTFLEQANAAGMFAKPYRWLILGRSTNIEDIMTTELKDLTILIDSDLTITQIQKDNAFSLNTVYKIDNSGEWYTEYFGTWEYNIGLNRSQNMNVSIALRRKNLRGKSIVMSIVITNNQTKTELMELGNIMIDTVSKGTFRHINPLYYFINATIDLIFSDAWGYSINGSWSGMIGHLSRGEADIGGTVTFITSHRMDVLEYLSHPTPTTVKFVFREPPLSYQNNLFLLPFKGSVWYCTAGFVVILIFVLYTNAKWELKKSESEDMGEVDYTALRPSVSDITMLIVTAICQQGSSNELKGTLGRIVMFILFLTFLFLYTSYSANIVALLQSNSNQIRTLSDLLHSKLELGVEDVIYNRYYFSTATEPIRKAIYDTKVAPKGTKANFMGIEEGVKSLQNKPFAFNMHVGVGYRIVERYFHEHEKCGLQEIEYIQENKAWSCCRKKSPFKELYKIGFFRIKEHGLGDRENRLIYAKKPVCAFRGGNFGSVNMVDFYPVLLMLLYGMIISFVLLLLEVLYHRKIKLSKG